MTKKAARIAVLYTLFAMLSTAINIASQMLSIWEYKGPFSIEISIFSYVEKFFSVSSKILFASLSIFLSDVTNPLSIK